MKVSEVMSKELIVIPPDATLQEAAEKMRDADVGALPVMSGDQPQGVVTDRDIVVRGLAKGQSLQQMKVKDVMSSQVEWIYDDKDVEEAAKMMREKQIRRVLVMNRTKKLAGIISLADMATGGTQEMKSKVLEGVSQPPTGH